MEPTEDNWKDVLRTNYADLMVKIDMSAEFQGRLKESKFFTHIQIQSMFGCYNDIDKIKQLIHFLERGDCDRFLKVRRALIDSGQKDVVAGYMTNIKAQPKISSFNDESNLSLDRGCYQQLQMKWNNLLQDIDITVLMPLVISKKIFTDYQISHINDSKSVIEKTQSILKLIERGSQHQYDQFCICLAESRQGHICSYLTPECQRPLPQYTKDAPAQHVAVQIIAQNVIVNQTVVSKKKKSRCLFCF